MNRVSISVPPFLSPLVTSYSAALLAEAATKLGHQVTMNAGYMAVADHALRAGLPWESYKRYMNEPFLGDLAVLPLLSDWDSSYENERRELASAWGVDTELDLVTNALDSWIDASVDALKHSDIAAISASHYAMAPSIALAQRLRERLPDLYLVVGGYFGSISAAQSIQDQHGNCLDCVVYGEAESVWPDILASKPRGVIRGLPSALNDSPTLQQHILAEAQQFPWIRKRLIASLEFSRGCYWDGCNFCNFNAGYGSGFRERRPRVLLDEIDALVERGIHRFQLLDTSVSVRLGRFLEAHDAWRDIYVFCEIRADFRRRDLQSLARLGVLSVQIGIESLSASHLLAMSKNATVSDNVRCLRACRDLGIPLTWGVFVGHPRETSEQLAEMLDAMRHLHHLPPPKYVTLCEVRPGSLLWHDEIESGRSALVFPHRAFDCYLRPADSFAELLPAQRVGGTARHLDMIALIQIEAERWRSSYEAKIARRVVHLAAGQLEVADDTGHHFHPLPDILVAALSHDRDNEVVVLSGEMAIAAIANGVAIPSGETNAVVVADLES